MRTFALGLIIMIVVAVPLPGLAQQRDFTKVEIKTTKITDTFYALEGEGGRICVLAGPDGILMVDSQFAPLTGRKTRRTRSGTGTAGRDL